MLNASLVLYYSFRSLRLCGPSMIDAIRRLERRECTCLALTAMCMCMADSAVCG
jgi:hypothetical protein